MQAEVQVARVATVLRNGLPESWHFGAAAVVAPGGRPVARLGDPTLATFLRSAAKPFQALPLVLAAGVDSFALAAEDLALICGSHSGCPEHTARAMHLLEKGGFKPDDLLCGAHWPLERKAGRELRRQVAEPSPLHNNCSGNHAGQLLACRLLDLPTDTYVDPDHSLQQRILRIVAALSGCRAGAVGLGVDGCSLPTFHLPLAGSAQAFAALADPQGAGLEDELAAALRQLGEAMAEAPVMVAGPGRFTTRLIQVTKGRILGKEGAEGYYAVAARGPEPLGIALKIAEGSERCRDGVVMEVLRQLGCLTDAELGELKGFYRRQVRNHRNLIVGEVVPELQIVRS